MLMETIHDRKVTTEYVVYCMVVYSIRSLYFISHKAAQNQYMPIKIY